MSSLTWFLTGVTLALTALMCAFAWVGEATTKDSPGMVTVATLCVSVALADGQVLGGLVWAVIAGLAWLTYRLRRHLPAEVER